MIRLGRHLLDLTVVGAERDGGRQLAQVVERTTVPLRLEHIADAAEVVGGVRWRVGRRVEDELEAEPVGEKGGESIVGGRG